MGLPEPVRTRWPPEVARHEGEAGPHLDVRLLPEEELAVTDQSLYTRSPFTLISLPACFHSNTGDGILIGDVGQK